MYERCSDEITDEARRIWLGRKEEARKEEARQAEERNPDRQKRVKSFKLRLRVAEMGLENARKILEGSEEGYQRIQEDIERVGPAKAWEANSWGISLIDLKFQKREVIQSQRVSAERHEKEREGILAEISADEEKLKNLK
jgi:hypothetical protein